MNPISWLFKRFDTIILPNLDAINYSAIVVPVVYRCVDLLSTALARAEIKYVLKPKDADNAATTRLPLPTILSRVDSFSLQRLYSDWILKGDGYMYIEPDRIVNVNVQESRWTDFANPDGTQTRVATRRVKRDSSITPFDVTDRSLVSLHWTGFDGLQSFNPCTVARPAIELLIAMETYRKRLGENQPPGYFVMDANNPQSAEVVSATKMAIKKAFNTTEGSTVLSAVERGKVMTSSEMGIQEGLSFAIEEICRVFGVPPAAVGHYLSGQRTDAPPTFAFPRHVVRSRASIVEAELTRKFISQSDREKGAVLVLDLEKIEAPDWETEASTVGRLVSDFAILTPNEGRRRLGLPDMLGGDELRSPKGAPPVATGRDTGQSER